MAVKFEDKNLKLALISCLTESNGLYLDEIKKLRDQAHERRFFHELELDDFLPNILEYYSNLDINQESLNLIMEFNPSSSNISYNLLVKEWSGEDDIFDIKSLDGIELLSNLAVFRPFGLLDWDVDIKALLKCKSLKTVYKEFLPDTIEVNLVVAKLLENGVELI